MIAGRNIVCIGSNWFDHPTSKHHVMRLLARDNHVVWVNFHASRRPQFNGADARHILRRLRQAWGGVQRVAPNVDMLSPLLVPMPESSLARGLNARLLARQIRRALRAVGPRPTQLWLFTPDVPELIDRFDLERVIYYCVDDFAAFTGFNTRLIESLEQQTMARSHVVLATSEELYAPRRARHACTHLVPHGVDYDHFARAVTLAPNQVAPELRDLPHPILGYMGLISDYVDLELIAAAARARPDFTFVLLGHHSCPVGAVTDLRNVHLLGPRPYEELPRYCAAFDIGLIPFRMNRLTRAVNPIKLRDYLAAGLPVVSAPMPAVSAYAPAVHLAETLGEFIPACERALRQAQFESPTTRQILVRDESWLARVQWISRLVMQRPPTGQSGPRPCYGVDESPPAGRPPACPVSTAP